MSDILTYAETREVLGISYSTLINAITRGILTPLPKRVHNNKVLLSKQVRLFHGRTERDTPKRLSLHSLSPDELLLWNGLNREIAAMNRPKDELIGVMSEDDIINGQIDISIDLIERIAALTSSVITELLLQNISTTTTDAILLSVQQKDKYRLALSVLKLQGIDTIPDVAMHRLTSACTALAKSAILDIIVAVRMSKKTDTGPVSLAGLFEMGGSC